MFLRRIAMVFVMVAVSTVVAAGESSIDWDAARNFWAFRRPVAGPAPAVLNVDWSRTRTDRFVLASLEKARLRPNPEAALPMLARRAAFDLTGLPPAPEAVRALVASSEPGAYERLVEELMGSRSFGERFASLWLNVARYAEDQAHLVGKNTSLFYPNAHKYRDWVVNAFNRDLPYDEFIRCQLAADLIAPGSVEELPALGFLGLGHKYYQRSRLEVRAEEWAGRHGIARFSG